MMTESPVLAASSRRTEARTAGLLLREKLRTFTNIVVPLPFLFRSVIAPRESLNFAHVE